MRFKIKGTQFRVSFSFFAVVLILLTCKRSALLINMLLFSAIHECGHLFVLKLCGITVKSFKLTLFGAEIERSDAVLTGYFKDALIAFGGPGFNLLAGAVCRLWGVVSNSVFLNNAAEINFYIAVFNLLPFFSFDGGIILTAVLSAVFGEAAAQKIGALFSYAVLLPFAVLSAAVFLNNPHEIFPGLISCFMLISLIYKK